MLFFMAIGYGTILAHRRVGRRIAQSLGIISGTRQLLAKHGRMSTKILAVSLVAIAGLITVESALLWASAVSAPGCGDSCGGFYSLSLASYRVTSPTNATLNIRNLGSLPITLTSYEVENYYTNTNSTPGWAGPTIPSGATVPVNFLIDGSAFTFVWEYSYTVKVITGQSWWLFSTGPLGPNIEFSRINTPTNTTMTVSNTGPGWINLTLYQVQDQAGHQYNSTNWLGPKVGPGMILPANVVIDGQTFTFQNGPTYIIRFFDSTSTEWSYQGNL